MFLIEQLAKAANMSSRFVIKYRTMHHAKGWCGNWIAAFLSDFVNSTDDEWEANYKELKEWWENYINPLNEQSVGEQLRTIVFWKLWKSGKENKFIRSHGRGRVRASKIKKAKLRKLFTK